MKYEVTLFDGGKQGNLYIKRMMKHFIFCCMLFFILFVSCDKDHTDDIQPLRTIIVYMAADNDLSPDALDDIEEMKKGFPSTHTNLIVFVDPSGEKPYLLRIGRNTGEKVKIYSEMISTDAGNMQKVLTDIIGLYPAESFGLILWSHGTSWLPAESTLKSFGDDMGNRINVNELAEVLPARFDFILFDACLMGAVEVAYELRFHTDFIIASSTEIIYTGFPYEKIIPELVKPVPDPVAAAEAYINFYEQLSGAYRSATIAVIDTKELERLADATNRLIAGQEFDISSFDRTTVQRLDVYEEQYVFDFFDFLDKAFPDADKSDWSAQLARAILYKANTPRFIDAYNINSYCGLSCYIPHPYRQDLNDCYRTLNWTVDSRFIELFH